MKTINKDKGECEQKDSIEDDKIEEALRNMGLEITSCEVLEFAERRVDSQDNILESLKAENRIASEEKTTGHNVNSKVIEIIDLADADADAEEHRDKDLLEHIETTEPIISLEDDPDEEETEDESLNISIDEPIGYFTQNTNEASETTTTETILLDDEDDEDYVVASTNTKNKECQTKHRLEKPLTEFKVTPQLTQDAIKNSSCSPSHHHQTKENSSITYIDLCKDSSLEDPQRTSSTSSPVHDFHESLHAVRELQHMLQPYNSDQDICSNLHGIQDSINDFANFLQKTHQNIELLEREQRKILRKYAAYHTSHTEVPSEIVVKIEVPEMPRQILKFPTTEILKCSLENMERNQEDEEKKESTAKKSSSPPVKSSYSTYSVTPSSAEHAITTQRHANFLLSPSNRHYEAGSEAFSTSQGEESFFSSPAYRLYKARSESSIHESQNPTHHFQQNISSHPCNSLISRNQPQEAATPNMQSHNRPSTSSDRPMPAVSNPARISYSLNINSTPIRENQLQIPIQNVTYHRDPRTFHQQISQDKDRQQQIQNQDLQTKISPHPSTSQNSWNQPNPRPDHLGPLRASPRNHSIHIHNSQIGASLSSRESSDAGATTSNSGNPPYFPANDSQISLAETFYTFSTDPRWAQCAQDQHPEASTGTNSEQKQRNSASPKTTLEAQGYSMPSTCTPQQIEGSILRLPSNSRLQSSRSSKLAKIVQNSEHYSLQKSTMRHNSRPQTESANLRTCLRTPSKSSTHSGSVTSQATSNRLSPTSLPTNNYPPEDATEAKKRKLEPEKRSYVYGGKPESLESEANRCRSSVIQRCSNQKESSLESKHQELAGSTASQRQQPRKPTASLHTHKEKIVKTKKISASRREPCNPSTKKNMAKTSATASPTDHHGCRDLGNPSPTNKIIKNPPNDHHVALRDFRKPETSFKEQLPKISSTLTIPSAIAGNSSPSSTRPYANSEEPLTTPRHPHVTPLSTKQPEPPQMIHHSTSSFMPHAPIPPIRPHAIHPHPSTHAANHSPANLPRPTFAPYSMHQPSSQMREHAWNFPSAPYLHHQAMDHRSNWCVGPNFMTNNQQAIQNSSIVSNPLLTPPQSMDQQSSTLFRPLPYHPYATSNDHLSAGIPMTPPADEGTFSVSPMNTAGYNQNIPRPYFLKNMEYQTYTFPPPMSDVYHH
uniref:Uncharacterized protein n=1 Tax=Stomoxys calcitrans TaxID=35570 RepID=A0A1I8QB46_STOCA